MGEHHIAMGWFLPRFPAGCMQPAGQCRMQGLTPEMSHLLLVRLLGAPRLPGPGSRTQL